MNSAEILDTISQALFDKKALNILALDLRPLELMTSYCIITEGTVERHVISLARQVVDTLSKLGIKPLFVEGDQEGDWIVLDYGEIVVHIMIPQMREKYQLENLWNASKIVDVNIDVESKKSRGLAG